MSRSRTLLAATAGALAGVAGIATSHALTGLLGLRATPIQAVAETVVERTPGPVAETLIHLVRQYDKPLLVAGVTAAILVLSAVAGIVGRRHRLRAYLIFFGMGAVALVTLLSRPAATPYTVIPVAAGVLTWVVLLDLLLGPLTREQAEGTPPEADPSRRAFLVRAGAVAAAAAVVGLGGNVFGQARRGVEAARSRLRLAAGRGTVPAGAQLDLPGITPWRVSNEAFYRIDTAIVPPAIDPADWRLRIHGMVEREIEIGYQDLLDRERTEAWVTLCCVSNEVGGDLIGNAFWSGVRVADLLAEAGPRPGADAVLQTSKDGWNCGTPLAALTDGRDALLAVAMNGEPLPVEHGFPVRMVVPGLYGFVSATKWVVDLEVTRFADFTAYWTERGWSAQGPVRTQSRIEVPRSGADVAAGKVRVGGSAWAQHTGIAKVEYRLDGGPWQQATLGRVPDADTWVQWEGAVDAVPGHHTLVVRATDRSGYTQTPVRRDVVPDGATGWHTVRFTAG